MVLKKASLIKPEMGKIDKLMRAKFESDIELVECQGPVQMCVFKLVYIYKPLNYKIIMDCERAILALYVINEEGKRFWPGMIYPDENCIHDYSKSSDVQRLIDSAYMAIAKKEIVFR